MPSKPLRPAGEPDLARDDAVLLPLAVERRDVLLRPRPHHVAELVVLRLVEGVTHADSVTDEASRPPASAVGEPPGRAECRTARGHLSTCPRSTGSPSPPGPGSPVPSCGP